ncbi:MAG: heme-copper oxidase subunit III [Chloroflexota bacterium]|nr:MAG: cytochrome oxidase subunit III [Chloroflexota bacterium]
MADTTAHGHGTAGHANIYTSLGVDSRKLGVWTFIGSETLFFTSLITTYLVYAPVNRARPDFQDPKAFLDIELTTVLASILLASSLTMVLALAANRRGDLKSFRNWLLATILLGLGFIGGQVYEFNHLYHEGLTLSSSLFGTTFFVLTGFHGTHVAIGVIWLLAVLVKVFRTPDSPENAMDVEIAGLYWHFVDLVWVAIFVLIYLI